MKKIFVGLVCIFLFSQIGSANQTNQEDWRQLYDNSLNHFYNHEYEKSIECLEKALKLNSGQLAIYWRLSYVLWLKAERTYQEHGKKVDGSTRAWFDEVINRGIEVCENILKNDPYNSEVLFYLGALYGHKGKFIATTNHRLKVGLSGAEILGLINKSREKLRKIKSTEPFYYEALAYLGLYNYGGMLFTPDIFKGRIKENKDLSDEDTEKWGLKELKEAMKYSKYSDDAKIVYRGTLQIKITEGDRKFENKMLEVIELTENLLKKYPRNLSLKVDLVILYQKKGELTRAYDMGKKLHREILEHPEYSKFYYIRYLYIKLAGVLSEIERTLKK